MEDYKMLVKHGGLMDRWYKTWKRLGGEHHAEALNFCQFMRIMLIWGPLRYFLKERFVKAAGWFPGITLAESVVGGIILGLFIVVEGAFIIALAIGAIIMAIFGGIVGVMFVLTPEGLDLDRKFTEAWTENITIPFHIWRTKPRWYCPFIEFEKEPQPTTTKPIKVTGFNK